MNGLELINSLSVSGDPSKISTGLIGRPAMINDPMRNANKPNPLNAVRKK
jgi:hypothetical protein